MDCSTLKPDSIAVVIIVASAKFSPSIFLISSRQLFNFATHSHIQHSSHSAHAVLMKFKVACITYEIVYLHSALKQYAPSRRLHSSDCSLLAVPRVCTYFGSRSFAVAELLPPPGTLSLFTFVTANPYFASAVNSKLFSINQPSTLCNAPPIHPSTSDSVVFLRHCAH